jgi:hypothetical protein
MSKSTTNSTYFFVTKSLLSFTHLKSNFKICYKDRLNGRDESSQSISIALILKRTGALNLFVWKLKIAGVA